MSKQFPDPPNPDPSAPIPVRDLIGETIEVVGTGTLRGETIAHLSDGRLVLCDTDWSAAGAGHLQARLASDGVEGFAVVVVEERDQVGFRPAVD